MDDCPKTYLFSKVAVPSTIHCDHLIEAQLGGEKDLHRAKVSVILCHWVPIQFHLRIKLHSIHCITTSVVFIIIP